MRDKRFTFYYERGSEVIIEDNGKRLSNKQLVDLLTELSDENGQLKEENERLKEKNEKLQWELDKTREDLNYFANLKVSAMRGDCGHDRCYITSMQKKGD